MKSHSNSELLLTKQVNTRLSCFSFTYTSVTITTKIESTKENSVLINKTPAIKKQYIVSNNLRINLSENLSKFSIVNIFLSIFIHFF